MTSKFLYKVKYASIAPILLQCDKLNQSKSTPYSVAVNASGGSVIWLSHVSNRSSLPRILLVLRPSQNVVDVVSLDIGLLIIIEMALWNQTLNIPTSLLIVPVCLLVETRNRWVIWHVSFSPIRAQVWHIYNTWVKWIILINSTILIQPLLLSL